MNRGRMRTLALAAATLLATAGTAAAQITTGTITGSVKDHTGAGIPGATAVLISDTRGTQLVDAVTNMQGDFVFANVPPDRYTLQVTMQGFKTFKQSDISVSPGDRASVGTVTLQVGGIAQMVQVKSEAPLIQSTSGERSFTIASPASRRGRRR